jgi:ribosomal protein L6P/L9E
MEKIYTVEIPENNRILFYKSFLVVISPLGFVATNINKFTARRNYIFTLDKFSFNIFSQTLSTNLDKENNLPVQYLHHLKKVVFGLNYFYTNRLVLKGTGFRLFTKYVEYNSTTNKVLVIKIGYGDDLCIDVPKNILVNCLNQTVVEIVGLEKDHVNEYCKLIKNFKKPDPYKGKGIGFFKDVIIYKQRKKS